MSQIKVTSSQLGEFQFSQNQRTKTYLGLYSQLCNEKPVEFRALTWSDLRILSFETQITLSTRILRSTSTVHLISIIQFHFPFQIKSKQENTLIDQSLETKNKITNHNKQKKKKNARSPKKESTKTTKTTKNQNRS